ncbi:hypothetical protein EV384_5468 [Micromonospora kangleipakensis]|uniref:DUF1272 domain-containing protein n=1 Tax=Micromonospora kangleipakensis TaxID=1077942 RepID=A0A4Q8BH36_9ACTN|nr:DUF1272 domain-containing protein [Micromonospora kangleipakensis]RZU76781.1 hypothetical protein EV384_5468 [Micromonospora kangleipakensis]
MLKMKQQCERCNGALPATAEAYVCSYECTYCPRCTEALTAACPNCAGELVRRPRRTTGAAAIAVRTPGRIVRLLRRSQRTRSRQPH